MNAFFRRAVLRQITDGNFDGGGAHFNTPAEYDELHPDWYDIAIDQDAEAVAMKNSLEAIYRSDGRIGIKFTPASISQFVIKLTPEGKRILGWDLDYIAVDENSSFSSDYLYRTFQGNLDVVIDIPNITESLICVLNNSVFNHGHYRHELSIVTTLPLQQYVECDQKSARYKTQLASYRYPNEKIETEYEGTLFKVLKEEHSNIYIFEHAQKTHNEFLLTGTELQNFHIRLVSRNYKWNESKQLFEIHEKPYPLHEDSLWTLGLKVKPLG